MMNNPEQITPSPHDGSARWSGAPGANLSLLSNRQRTIAWLIAQGQTNHQIGAELDLDRASVAEEVEQLRRVLGVDSRLQLAVLVRQQGPIAGTEQRGEADGSARGS